MKILIERLDDDNIITAVDCSDPKDSGEIAHFLAELELVKISLLGLWEEMKDGA